MKLPRAIVFDFDGVIVNSEPVRYRVFRELLGNLGGRYTWEDYVERLVVYADRDLFRVVGDELREAGVTIDVEANVAAMGAMLDTMEDRVEAIPGSLDFVRSMASQIPVAIASGAMRRDIERELAPHDLLDRFSTIVTADDVEHSKPDPETYLLAVERLHSSCPSLEPRECLAFEDSTGGVASAKAAGLFVVGITTNCPARLLTQTDHVIDAYKGVRLEDLTEWMRRPLRGKTQSSELK